MLFLTGCRRANKECSKDFYLTKSQVMRRFRGNKLRGDCDENLLGGLLHEMNETQQLLGLYATSFG